jgi:cobalamin transport system permease protein
MKSISTTRGDAGETSLAGGVRVSKSSVRVEAYGTIDELNSTLGFARSICEDREIVEFARSVQQDVGSFSGVTWQRLKLFGPLTLVGVFIASMTTKQLNALLMGENYARSMGLAVRRIRLITMFGASLLGAVVTAFCGPISFLGIAIPHLCRGLLGTSDHRALVPAVVLLGAAVALLAQMLSLVPGSAGVLPLNAVTSLIGAPVVVVVLLRTRRGAFAP